MPKGGSWRVISFFLISYFFFFMLFLKCTCRPPQLLDMASELVQVVSSSGTVPVSPDSIETLLALNATELNDWLNSMTQAKFNAFCGTLMAAGCVSAPVRLAWKDLTVTENGITVLDKVSGIIEPGIYPPCCPCLVSDSLR